MPWTFTTSSSSLLSDLTAEDEDEDGGPVDAGMDTGNCGGKDGAGDDDEGNGIGDNGDGGAGGRKAALGVAGASPCA